MNSWKHIKDGYPISGPNDPKFDGTWYEQRVEVMNESGLVKQCVFWACWDEEYDFPIGDNFLMEFDCDSFNVMYWRALE